MNFDMFSNKPNNDLDSNYIYPSPYIDPTMYMNQFPMNQNQPQMQGSQVNPYVTYMNPYMNNPMMGPCPVAESNYNECDYDDSYVSPNNQSGMMPNNNMGYPQGNTTPNSNMQYIPNGMMPGMMMPYYPNMQFMPNGMIPNGMMPGMMMPFMPWMMSPYMMMPGMPQIHLEEFDEEEM